MHGGNMNNGVTGLWERYTRSRAPADRNRLVEHYLGWAMRSAEIYASRLPSHVDRCEVRSDAQAALIDLVERFDPSRGVQFETFALWVIRGRVLDGLRRRDPVSRQSRALARRRAAAETRLGRRLGRMPIDQELLDELGWTPGQLARSRPARTKSLSTRPAAMGDEEELEISGMVVAAPPAGPGIEAIEEAAAWTRGLTFVERMVVVLHDACGVTMEEISRMLGVCPSRVSQIHQRAVGALRGWRTRDLASHRRGDP